MIKKTHIIIHHSATKDGPTLSWHAIRKYHIETNGWFDIGYHFGIELFDDGVQVLCGRMLTDRGAHCVQNKMNDISIGICIVGNYDLIEPPQNVWDAGVKLVASLCVFGGIDTDNVQPHGLYNTGKSCPGEMFNMDAFRLDVKTRCRQMQ